MDIQSHAMYNNNPQCLIKYIPLRNFDTLALCDKWSSCGLFHFIKICLWIFWNSFPFFIAKRSSDSNNICSYKTATERKKNERGKSSKAIYKVYECSNFYVYIDTCWISPSMAFIFFFYLPHSQIHTQEEFFYTASFFYIDMLDISNVRKMPTI
jgi:hypothetical protein